MKGQMSGRNREQRSSDTVGPRRPGVGRESGYWRLRSRKDGVVWSVIASLIAMATYWLVFLFLTAGPSVFGAIGLGIGTMVGGLVGTLYWLPKENGS